MASRRTHTRKACALAALLTACLIVPFILSDCASGAGSGGSLHYSYADLSGTDLDRTANGVNAIPIWSPLTAPEQTALQDRDKARAGDPDALLGLAILASGDQRSPTEYAAIRADVAAFVAKIRPELAAEKSPWQKGFKLHRAMHACFFPPAVAGDGTPSGYEWGESRLTGIFTRHKYNCISSTLLYLVLAREFGFDVKGVLLPSHAFAQLTLPDGKIIEVETTTPSGFDWIHDEAFYNKRATAWFSARGLPASSYKDYQARKIMEPVELIAANMSNQHTVTERMAPPDRRRLIEARAWTDPAGADGQVNRIALYASEYKSLSEKGDWKSLERMYRVVSPSFTPLRKTWAADAELANHIAWHAYYFANVLRGVGRIPEAFNWIDSSLAWLRLDAKEGALLKSNNTAVICMITRELAERKEFASAEGDLLRYPTLLREDDNFKSQITWVYQEWAAQAWERKDWEGAAALFGKALAYAPKQFRKPVQDNMASAYLNKAVGLQNEGDWPKAKAALRKCLEKVPEARKCKTSMDELVAQHNLDE